MAPIEPPQHAWTLLLMSAEPGEDLAGVGADLEPETVLSAYRNGLFPMGLGRRGEPPIGWWSPDPRGVLPLDGLRVARSLRKVLPRFEVRIDTAFDAVVSACADPGRDGRWITPQIASTYGELHRRGWAHSVEAWQGGELVGGLYGIAVGGLFAGESMFHRVNDASKVAFVALVELLTDAGDAPRRLLDVQWRTEHLATLGVIQIPRAEYLQRLPAALEVPLPALWA